MKKSIIKIISFVLVLLALSLPFEVYAHGIVSEEKIDIYLADKGLPDYFIRLLKPDLKKQIYTQNLEFNSIERSYGILSENYSIKYTIEAGKVVIDKENLNMLDKLRNDETEIAKILMGKEYAENTVALNINDEIMIKEYKESNHDLIREIKSSSTENTIKSLGNWEAVMTVIHLSYKNSVSEKLAVYGWDWKSTLVNNWKDKAAMAWSGGYTAIPSTFEWTYVTTNNSGGYKEYYGTNYTDYTPNVGIGTEIDIKTLTNGFITKTHGGMIIVTLRKSTSTNSSQSAVGTYFHKIVVLSAALTFDGSPTPAISVSISGRYRKAADEACAFWTKS